MHFSTLVTLALSSALVSAQTNSSAADADAATWDQVLPRYIPRSTPWYTSASNLFAKRQAAWSPPANLVTPINQVWNHVETTYTNWNGFRNYGWDQLIANKGYINYCVRWESNTAITEAQRAQLATAVQRSHDKWMKWVIGFQKFPYASVPVKVVGYAVNNRNLVQGSTSGLDIYTGFTREGATNCDPACGRFFHQDNNYSQCPGGAARHYDMTLWLTDGFSGGAGGDWGQRIGREYFMGAVNQDNIHILLHEMGHTYGLDDFYDWTPSGVTSFIMKAGAALQVTDFDGWMLRDWWRHLASRYGLA